MNDESTLGRTIRIYLADGSPTGIRHAELVNWTIQAIVCPRGRVPALAQWQEAKRPGVYLLVGENEGAPLAYVGESENVWKRLQHHIAQKDFWQQVVFVTSKDDNLTKAHVKYVESRFQALAEKAARIPLEKGKASDEPNLPKPDRDAMEEYIRSARILLTALGFPYLEMPAESIAVKTSPSPGSGDPGLNGVKLHFSVKKNNVQATGAVTDEGFVVFQGSVGSITATPTMPPGWNTLRAQALADGSMVVDNGVLRFTKDVLFSSPSAAAAVLAGSNRNGRRDWKTSDGRSIADIEESQAKVEPKAAKGADEA